MLNPQITEELDPDYIPVQWGADVRQKQPDIFNPLFLQEKKRIFWWTINAYGGHDFI